MNYLYNDLNTYLNEIKKYPPLNVNEEKEIIKLAQNGDQKSRDKLIKANLNLVVQIARRMFPTTIYDLNDFIQEGNIALIEAIDRYDEKKQTCFSAYANNTIYFSLLRAINRKAQDVYIPASERELWNKYHKMKNKYYEKYGYYPTKNEIKDILKITEKEYQYINYIDINVIKPAYLNDNNPENDGLELETIIPFIEREYINIETKIDQKIFLTWIINKLSPLEYYVIYYRYFNNPPLNSKEICHNLYDYVSRQNIEQTEKIAIKTIKRYLFINRKNFTPDLKSDYQTLIPINFKTLIILLALKNTIDSFSYYLIYNIWYKKKTLSEIAEILNIDLNNLSSKYLSLTNLINEYNNNIIKIIANLKQNYKLSQILKMQENLEPTFIENTISKTKI